jgi:hypothetical protein
VKPRKGPRVGVGILLVILGLKNAVYPYPSTPVGAVEDFVYYGVSAVIVVIGVWLIFRGRKAEKPADERLSEHQAGAAQGMKEN